MQGCGIRKNAMIRPDFNRRIRLDFQGASLSSDTGFLLLREIDERFGIIEENGEALKDIELGASHSILSRVENDILGNAEGLKALDEEILRAAEDLIKKKWKYRFILDLDVRNDPTQTIFADQRGVGPDLGSSLEHSISNAKPVPGRSLAGWCSRLIGTMMSFSLRKSSRSTMGV